MSLSRCTAVLLLVTLVIAVQAQGQLPAEVYATPGPHVVVNGKYLNVPLTQKNGSLLLPMRAVFEALQAEVTWIGPTQQIIAKRGETVVTLWMNKKSALINEKAITLSVPPTPVKGSTYVPLRFPAEAFGGEVKWLADTQTALITITPLATEAPTVARTVSGTLVNKVETPVQAVLVQTANDASLVQLAKEAAITRDRTESATTKATFAELEIGDQVSITTDATGKAVRVAAIFSRETGTIAGVAQGHLLMSSGALYTLDPNVAITDTAASTLTMADLKPGTNVTLYLVPKTETAWKVVLPKTTATTTTTNQPAATTGQGVTKALAILSPADKSIFGKTVVLKGEATSGVTVRVTLEYAKTAWKIGIRNVLYNKEITVNADGSWATDEVTTSLPLIGTVDTIYATAEQLDAAGNVANSVKITLTRQ